MKDSEIIKLLEKIEDAQNRMVTTNQAIIGAVVFVVVFFLVLAITL